METVTYQGKFLGRPVNIIPDGHIQLDTSKLVLELDYGLPRLERVAKLKDYENFLAKKLRLSNPHFLVFNDYLKDWEEVVKEIEVQTAYLGVKS